MKQVNHALPKKNASALLLGKPVYTDDLAPTDALVVRLLRSPHAHAEIVSVDTAAALRIPGVVKVLTWEDVPQVRFTVAGQAVPQWSPIDHLILERTVRYIGDPVAIVAGETEAAVEKALSAIRVKYNILPAITDFREALDNDVLVHAEDDWKAIAPFGADAKRNLCAYELDTIGDFEKQYALCAWKVENIFHTCQVNQSCMETYQAYTAKDAWGRLTVVSSTQIPFHLRRIVADALQIPVSKVRVIKPQVGGGFGSKQSAIAEVYPAIVTWLTGRPAKIQFTRKEFFTAGNPRHEMQIHIRLGADADGKIRAIEMTTLSNTGAYGEHGPTTITLCGRQPLSFYRYAKDLRFEGTVVYTNTVPAGAYRGFGIPQGAFAVESCVNHLASVMGMDPAEIRRINMLQQGDAMGIYNGGEITNSCRLQDCLDLGIKAFDWENRSRKRVMPDGKIRAGGLAVAMQGSGIANVDTASASLRLIEDGSYVLGIGAADMGTGCDTILAQMAAEVLECDTADVHTAPVDTDYSPYDTGSYASSTTYVTGGAVVKAANQLKEKILAAAAQQLGCEEKDLTLLADRVESPKGAVSLKELVLQAQSGGKETYQATATNSRPVSPPPFMISMVEVEVDPETGSTKVLHVTNTIDCGTVINPALARVQAEGAAMQALGMALSEKVVFDKQGKLITDSFMTYGLPTRLDCPDIDILFCPSYEETGPFGAKSIGEIAINTTAPAIADAVYRATGIRFTELPITPEKVFMALHREDGSH